MVTFQALTESKERKIKHQLEESKKARKKLKDETSKDLTTRLKNMILSVDGEYDQKIITNFVDNELFAVDSKALRTHISEVTPDIDLTWEFVSDETGERRNMLLPMEAGFFWPKS
jgi:predicted transcriptional regulator